jgi:zinc protease
MRWLLAVPIPFVFAASALAQANPTAEEVLDRYARALGGRAAVEKVTTRYMKGVREFPASGQSGAWEAYDKLPNKWLTIHDGPSGTTTVGTNDRTWWSLQPIDGFSERPLGDAPKIPALHREVRLREMYVALALKGKEKVGGREAWRVDATGPAGGVTKMYFDVETGLLLRRVQMQRVSRRSGNEEPTYSTVEITQDFEDYRDVDGVKVPFTVRNHGGLDYTTRYTEVRVNLAISDSKFDKPAGF